MEWTHVTSIDELKKLGKLKDVSAKIAQDLNRDKVPKNRWDKLFKYIMEMQADKNIEEPQTETNSAEITIEPENILEVHTSTDEAIKPPIDEKASKWKLIQSIEEIRKPGAVFRTEVEAFMADNPQVKVKPRGWDALWQWIQAIKVEDKTEVRTEVKAEAKTETQNKEKHVESDVVEEIEQEETQEETQEQETIQAVETEVSKDDSLYFKDAASEMIFYLLELKGEQRLEKLGVNKQHYHDKKIAGDWMKNTMKCIHPDQCTHIKSSEATIELNKMYGEMMRYAK